MKKITLYFFTITLLVSCQFTEELYIEEDGSGKMSIKFDGSGVMQMMASKFKDEKNEKDIKKFDTILDFKTLLNKMKDSIATLSEKEQKKLKALENFKMKTTIDPEALKMNFDMFTSFKSVNELDNLFSNFQKGLSLTKDKNKFLNSKKSTVPTTTSNTKDPSSRVDYSFKKNKFTRLSTIINKEKLKKEIDSIAPMEAFLGASKYTLKYHFPKKIKQVSNENALFSQDRKTLTLEIGFLEYMKNPKSLDIEVKLED